jgi:hypothetical protein
VTALLAPLRRPLAVVLALVALVAIACVPEPDPSTRTRAVMGHSSLTWEQLTWYYWSHEPDTGETKLTVSIPDLTSYFVWEGTLEGVKGDIAFAESIIETGWFRYGGQVDWTQNNFAGIGAVDGGAQGATFPNAVTGVRAQIQHLRAYADSTATKCEQPPLNNPCVDPRFHLVSPKGKAPTWEHMGSGNWASDPDYASKVISLYNDMREFAGLPPI